MTGMHLDASVDPDDGPRPAQLARVGNALSDGRLNAAGAVPQQDTQVLLAVVRVRGLDLPNQ